MPRKDGFNRLVKIFHLTTKIVITGRFILN